MAAQPVFQIPSSQPVADAFSPATNRQKSTVPTAFPGIAVDDAAAASLTGSAAAALAGPCLTGPAAPTPAATGTPQAASPHDAAKDHVVLLLASGKSITAAAEAAGVHRSTIHQWLKRDPSFARAVDAARGEYVETLRDKLRDQAVLAVQTLTDLLTDPKTPPSVRLRAALAVLQRPQFPKPGWNLREPLEPEHERRLLDHLAVIDADYRIMKMSRSLNAAAGSPSALAASTRQKSTQFDTRPVSSDLRSPNSDLPSSTRQKSTHFDARPVSSDLRSPNSDLPSSPRPKSTHFDTPRDSHLSRVESAVIARNAPCPCGSGEKYKRCCGTTAPPVLGS